MKGIKKLAMMVFSTLLASSVSIGMSPSVDAHGTPADGEIQYYFIVLRRGYDNGPFLEFAEELSKTIENRYHYAPEVIKAENFDYSSDAILIGDNGANLLSKDGFAITSSVEENHRFPTVSGGSPRAHLYGISWIIDKIRTGHDFPENVFREPDFEHRLVTALEPGGNAERWADYLRRMVKYGYSGLVVPSVVDVVTYEDLNLLTENDLRRIGDEREKYEELIGYASELGLDVYFYADEFRCPVSVADYIGEISITNPRFWEVQRAKYNELFRNFPEIDGVMVRTGETYGDHGLKILRIDSPESMRRAGIDHTQLLRHFTSRMENIIVHEHGKTYIQRTWATGLNNWHTDQSLYLESTEGLSKRTMMSVKYTQADFWSHMPHNPTIGVGDLPQLVEYQCQREYEGKGLFPNYVGKRYGKSVREIRRKNNVLGVWVWPQGGGPKQGEIELFYEGYWLWVDANFYVTSRLAWDPEENVERIALDWAKWRFGDGSAEPVAKALMLSENVAMNGFYMGAFAEHQLWEPQMFIRWNEINPSVMSFVSLFCLGDLDRDMGEDSHALEKSEEMYSSLEGVVDDETLGTVKHEVELMRLLKDFREASLRFYGWQLFGDFRGLWRSLEKLRSSLDTYENHHPCHYTREFTPGLGWQTRIFSNSYRVDRVKSFLEMAEVWKSVPLFPTLMLIAVVGILLRRYRG